MIKIIVIYTFFFIINGPIFFVENNKISSNDVSVKKLC